MSHTIVFKLYIIQLKIFYTKNQENYKLNDKSQSTDTST